MIDPIFPSLRARRFAFALVLVGLVVFGLTDVRSRARVDDPTKHMSDLTCYTEAGAALFDGRDPYEVSNPRGWRYLYLPLLALIVAPLHVLHPQWQAVIWFLANVAMAFGCYFECIRLLQLPSGVRGGSPPLAAVVPAWLRITPFLSVVCYGVSTLQLGQVSVGLLYFMLLGLRLVLTTGALSRWVAGGMAFAVAVTIKLFPALPVALLASVLWLSPREGGAVPRPRERALGMTAGVLGGVLAFVLVLPALVVGWQANLHHLRSFAGRVVSPIGIRVDASNPVFSHRNQSFLDAAQTFGTWIWIGGKIPPEPEWNKLSSPLRTSAVRRSLYGVEGLFVVLLIAAGWRLGRAGDAVGLCAAFGLACTVSLLVSPVAWAHSFVVTLPAAIFVPWWLWRRRASWLPIAVAVVLIVLGVEFYTFRSTLKEIAVLGVGTAGWFLWVCWLVLVRGPYSRPLVASRVATASDLESPR